MAYEILLQSDVEPYEAVVPLIEGSCNIRMWTRQEPDADTDLEAIVGMYVYSHMSVGASLMQRMPKPNDIGEYYRIYFSYGHDNFYRGTPSEAPDPYELTLPLAPVLKQYQMRCYASTELIKGEDGWYSPDLFDYSLFKERFERRELK